MDKSTRRQVAQLGGLARIRTHGNPGTSEGRRKGGLISSRTQSKRATGFKTLRAIQIPRHSCELAELFGIISGDGHIGAYQVSVTTNSETDFLHAKYTQKLFARLFGILPSLSLKKGKRACVILVSSKNVSDFLVKNDLVRGNKVHSGLRMPEWIRKREAYRKAFVRGLFDTDGSVYTDIHKIRGRTYKNLGLMLSNRSVPLLSDFRSVLEDMGLRPTQKTKFAVFLRREEEIRIYFERIGSSNPKHARKAEEFFLARRSGGVA